MSRLFLAVLVAIVLSASSALAQTNGDAKRGAALYRSCVACHSLEPGAHLTGPSLSGLWGKMAGRAVGFLRYSRGLKSAAFEWDETTLNGWLADPRAMIPDTYMSFRGIADEKARADLIAFLALAMKPGGAKVVVDRGLLSPGFVRGQQPDPLKSAPNDVRVSMVRHCGDSYFVTTADGVETPYWEMNVRIKIDSRATGPEPGKPVIVGAGMQGDRVSLVFARLPEVARFIAEAC